MKIRIVGITANASKTGQFYTIASVSGSTITLNSDAKLVTELGKDVTITPDIKKILILQREDVDISATGNITIDSAGDVYLGSGKFNNTYYDLNIASMTAGGTIRIKGDLAIVNPLNSSATNIAGGNLVVEAAKGSIGTQALNLYTDLDGGATLTGRALNDIYMVEREGNMNVASLYAQTGDVHLSTLNGSIVDALNNDFAKIAANNIYLDANNGGIGETDASGRTTDYLDVDVNGDGILNAEAAGSISVYETLGHMYVDRVGSTGGNVDLRAHLSILDAAGLTADEVIVVGNDITLISDTQGIGLSSDDINIDGAHPGSGVLRSSSAYGNTYIKEPVGDLALYEVGAGQGFTVFITTPAGSILNGRTDEGSNLTSGNAYLVASSNIGAADKPLRSVVGNIEGESTHGSTWVVNTGDLTEGGVPGASGPTGLTGGGSGELIAMSPITVIEDAVYTEHLTLTATDSAGTGDDLTVTDGFKVQSTASYVELRAGDDLLIKWARLMRWMQRSRRPPKPGSTAIMAMRMRASAARSPWRAR